MGGWVGGEGRQSEEEGAAIIPWKCPNQQEAGSAAADGKLCPERS